MAKKMSFKNQIFQQITNQQVQQVLNQQREQQTANLMADFNSFMEQQQNPEALMADFNAWKEQNSTPVQPAPQPQVKASAPSQEQIPSIADFFKPITASGKDINKATANYRNREEYQRQQQLEQIEAAQLHNASEREVLASLGDISKKLSNITPETEALDTITKTWKRGQRLEATDTSSQVAARVTNEKKPEIDTSNVPVNVDRWLSPDTKLTEAEKKKAKEYASAELQKVQYGPNKMPLFENEEQRQHYADMVNLINKTNGFTNFMSGAIEVPYNLADMVSDGARSVGNQLGGLGAAITDKLGITEGATQRHNEQAEIANQFADQNEANMRQSFKNAQTQNPGAYTAGKIAGQTGMYMLTNPVFDGIAAGAGVESELAKFFINQGAQNVQDLVLDTAPTVRQLMEDGSTPEEVKREALSNILWNVAGNAVMGGLGAWAGNRAARKASDEAFRENVRAGADNLSRIANEIPGIEDADNVVRNATRQAETAAQNVENLNKQIPNLPDYVTGGPTGGYDVALPEIPEELNHLLETETSNIADNIDNTVKANNTSKYSADEIAEMEKYVSERERLLKENLQAFEPGQTISISGNEKMLKEVEQRTRSINAMDGYMYDKYPDLFDEAGNFKGVPVDNAAEIVDDAAKTQREIKPSIDFPEDVQEKISSDFEEIYKAMEDMRSVVESSGSQKVADKYEKLQQAVFKYEELAYNSESLEEINKAKKAADAAKQGFIREVKKIDPNFKGSLTGTKLGNAEFRRTSTAPTDSALLDEIVDDMVKQDMENPNRFVRDANKADIPVNAPVSGNSELEIHTIHGRNGREIYQVVSREGDLLTPVEPGKTFNTREEAEKAIDQYKTMAESISKPKSDIITSEPIEPGKYEIPDTPENAPIDVPPVDGMKERGTSKHIRNAGTPMKMEDVADEVAADFEKDPDMYKVLRNADTKAKAEQIYNTSDNPEIEFRSLLEKKDPAALPLGHQLAKDYSDAGNHDAAAQIYRDMGKALTESGQFSQAAIINMVKNDPMTALQYAQKEIDSLNDVGRKRFGDRWKDFELTQQEIDAFKGIKAGDADAIKAIYENIGNRLGKEYPTTLWDKIIEARRVAMLFNPRTNVRNLGANPPTLAMRWLSDRVEAVGQNIAHLINPDIKVTQSLTGSGIRGRKIASEVYDSNVVKSMLNNSGSKSDLPELKNSVMQHKQVFKGTALEKWIDRVTDGGIQKLNQKLFDINGVQSIPETVRNATYKLLDLGDRPFVKENFVERLGSYINATGIKSADDVPEEAIQIAWEEAMKATYKDNSWAVDMLRNIKKGVEKADNVVPGLGTAISQSAIPFVQAPGNIAARMVDYSPVGAGKGIANIIKGARANDVKAVTKGIEEASKGLTGTGLIYLGMKLRESGLVTGTYSENKRQKAFEKQNGFKEFALHVGDKYFTYGWAQPAAQTIMVGSLLQDAIEKSDEYDSDMLNYFGIENSKAGKGIGVVKAGTRAAVNSWFNESPLSGLADFLKGNSYSDTDIASNLWENGVQDFAGALVPSVVNATAKVVDTTQRNAYDPSNTFGTFVNSNIAKIPGLSKTLPAKYDTWGREMKYAETKGAAAAARYAIPGEYSYDRSDKIDNEINRLFSEAKDEKGQLIQDSGVFPTVAPNAVGDKKLNNKEVSEYQKDMGARSRTAVETFMASDAYKSMGDPEKIEAIKKIYGASNAITKRDKFDYPLADNSEYKKAVAVYDKAGGGEKGAKALAEFYSNRAFAEQSGLSASSKAFQDIENDLAEGNTEAAQQKVDAAQRLPELGLDMPGPAATYNKAVGVIPGITVDDFAKTYKAMDADHNQALKKVEVIDYMNSKNMGQSEGMRFWKAYAKTEGERPWKIPSLNDGTWK